MILFKISVFALLVSFVSCAFTITCEVSEAYRGAAVKKLAGLLDNAAKIWECGKNFDQDTFSECIENEDSLNSYRNVVLMLKSADFENEASFISAIKKCADVLCYAWHREGPFANICLEGGIFSSNEPLDTDNDNESNEHYTEEVEDENADIDDHVDPALSSNDPVDTGPSSNEPVEPESSDNAIAIVEPAPSRNSLAEPDLPDKHSPEPETAQKPSTNVVELDEYDIDFKRPDRNRSQISKNREVLFIIA